MLRVYYLSSQLEDEEWMKISEWFLLVDIRKDIWPQTLHQCPFLSFAVKSKCQLRLIELDN